MEHRTDKLTERQGDDDGEEVSPNAGLSLLWEKAEAAAALIGKMRSENRKLQEQVASLTLDVGRLRAELDMVRISTPSGAGNHDVEPGNGIAVFGESEREALAIRVKEILARIDEYL